MSCNRNPKVMQKRSDHVQSYATVLQNYSKQISKRDNARHSSKFVQKLSKCRPNVFPGFTNINKYCNACPGYTTNENMFIWICE